MKKCHICAKPSVYHVTILQNGQVKELHLCEHHFHDYMSQPSSDVTALQEEMIGEGEDLPEEFAQESEKRCPNCGISFQEFREQGRFGCPNDYYVFYDRLVPLLQNIQQATEHVGRTPKSATGNSSQQHYELIKLRRDLAQAVESENYELAARLRDQIRQSEKHSAS